MRRAVGSWTTPRRNGTSDPPHGQASGRQRSVGAIAAAHDSGGRNVVSFMPERIEDLRLRVAIEPLAAHAAHDVAEQEEVDVAVDEPLARRRGRHLFDGAPNRFVGAVELDLELEIRPQPRRVRQQMADRDRRPCRSGRTRE